MMELWRLFLAFLQIGLFSIGGGYAVIPAIQQQVVETYEWISQRVFTDILTISQMTPGPLAVNTSTFVGIRIAGVPGAVVATIGCILPGVTLSLLLYAFFQRHSASLYAADVLRGLQAASLGLIMGAAAAILMLTFFGTSVFGEVSGVEWPAVILCGLCFFVLRKWKVSPILMLAAAGLAGVLLYGLG